MTNTAVSRTGAFPPAPENRHPEVDRWLAYRAGEATETETRDLQEHLAECRECTTLVLDLDDFAAPPGRGTPASEFEKAAVWRALQPHLEPRRRPLFGRRGAAALPLAASFLLAALGVGLWNQQRQLTDLRRQAQELTRPQANVPIHDLYPRSAVRGGASPAGALDRPAAATMTLVLNSLAPAPGTAFRARILDSEERERLTVDGLVTDEMGIITLSLSRDALAAGEYLVRLEAASASGWLEHEDFPLAIRDP